MTSAIDQHWIWMFGIEPADYLESPLTVLGHNSPYFAGYNGAWIFERQGRWIITIPDAIRGQVLAMAQSIPVEIRHTEIGVSVLFQGLRTIKRIIGPAFHGAALPGDFVPDTSGRARRLEPSDRPAVEQLLGECDPENVDHSGIKPESEQLFGCFVEGKLVSTAIQIDISSYASTPGILTHPSFRGQGFGKAAVSAAMAAIFEGGKSVVYKTLESNAPAVSIALALGCQPYARHMAVRFS